MYTASFPDGTIHAIRLPTKVYDALMQFVDAEGVVDEAAGPVYGNYLMFSGYKVKISKFEVTPTTYKVRIV